MPTTESMLLGSTIAAELGMRKLVVVAKPASALNQVIDATDLPAVPVAGLSDVELAVELTKANAVLRGADDQLIQSLQSLAISKVVKMGVGGINNNIDALRNLVKPFLEKVATAVIADVNATPSQFKTSYEIIQKRPPALYAIPAFKTLLERFATREGYAAAPAVDYGLIRFPSLGKEDVLNVIKNAFTEGVATQLLAKIGDWFDTEVDLEKVWTKFFADPRGTYPGFSKITTQTVLMDNTPDEIAAAYLLVVGLLNEPVEGVRASINELETYLTMVAFNFSAQISATISLNESAAKNGRLVIGRSRDGRSITVDSDVYDLWTSDENLNGQPDALLGMLATGTQATFLADVVAIQDKMVAEWHRATSMDLRTHQNEQLSMMQRSLIHHTETNLRAHPDAVSGLMESFDKSMNFVRNQALSLTVSDLDNIYQAVMRILTQGIFYRTDAYYFFNTVLEISAKNPSMPYQEVENMAIIEMVGRWLAHQMKVLPETHPAIHGITSSAY